MGRRIAGYVGLKNHGATCYMNCLLQTLFHIGRFRNMVYSIECPEGADQAGPASDDALEGSSGALGLCDDRPALPLLAALQNLFYRLQTSEAPVSCRELMRSFGWDTSDAFMQHDAQELNRLLCDRLEEQMKGTAMDGEIKRLFEGDMENYIECCDIKYTSHRNETFYDLQLNVKNDAGKELLSLEESLRDFTSEETLEGDNAYDAEGLGKQRARKGCRFKRFPPVLYIQLKRFMFDPERMDMCKLNNRLEFPEVLDLEAFAPGSGKYLLHTVVVHSGGVSSGHYYAFARTPTPGDPNGGTRWVKFDDEQVSLCSAYAAVEENYGGEDPMIWDYFSLAPHEIAAARGPTTKRVHNAYMLSYVKEDKFEEIISAPNLEMEKQYRDLIERCEREARLNEERKKTKVEQMSTVEVQLLLERDLTRLEGFWSHHELPCTHRFRMPRDRTSEDLWRKAEELFGVSYTNMALFLLQLRKTDQTRFKIMPMQKALGQLPTCGGPPHSPGQLVVLCVVSRGYCPQTLELKASSPDGKVPHEIFPHEIFRWSEELCLLIVKYFCPTMQKLITLGCYYTLQQDPIDIMVSQGWLADRLKRFVDAKEVAPLAEGAALMCWEEFNQRSPKDVVLRNPKESVDKEGLYNGDIIVWQPLPPQAAAGDRPQREGQDIAQGGDDARGGGVEEAFPDDEAAAPPQTVKDFAMQIANRVRVHVRIHRAEEPWAPEGLAAEGALGRRAWMVPPSPTREEASEVGGSEADSWREITADWRWRSSTFASRAIKAFGVEKEMEQRTGVWLFEHRSFYLDSPPCFRSEVSGSAGRCLLLSELRLDFGRPEMHMVLVPMASPGLPRPLSVQPQRRPVIVHFFDASVHEVGAAVLHPRDMAHEAHGDEGSEHSPRERVEPPSIDRPAVRLREADVASDLGAYGDSDCPPDDCETGRPALDPEEVLELARRHAESPGNEGLLAKLWAAAKAEGHLVAHEPRRAPPLRLLDTFEGRIRRVYRQRASSPTEEPEPEPAGGESGAGVVAEASACGRQGPRLRKRPRPAPVVWPARGRNMFLRALRVEVDTDRPAVAEAAAEGSATSVVEVIQVEPSGQLFGHPFLLRAPLAASGAILRAGLQAKLGLADSEVSQWRLKVVTPRELKARAPMPKDEQPIGERLRDSDSFPSRAGLEMDRGMPVWSPASCRLCIERANPARLTTRSPTVSRGLRIQKPLAIKAAAGGEAAPGDAAERPAP